MEIEYFDGGGGGGGGGRRGFWFFLDWRIVNGHSGWQTGYRCMRDHSAL